MSSHYWTRALKSDISTIRFYYAISVGTILGFNAYESVGASCLKSKTVSEDNKFFKQMLKFVGMRTLKDMAIKNARVVTKQAFKLFDGGLYTLSSTRVDPKSISAQAANCE